uniref:ADAMTS like 5 n=1 Tax=Scophthalmus maximus TaxID=52904 RepID=A0A8D3CTS3_SCOMX
MAHTHTHTHTHWSWKATTGGQALQNRHSQFVINGNWKISVPGEYSVAGTKLLYRRSADTWESFEVPGPTQEDLHLMVSVGGGGTLFSLLGPELYSLWGNRKKSLVSRSADRFSSCLCCVPDRRLLSFNVYTTNVSPSVFRARVLGKLYRGEETRYDVQILHTYRNGFRLEHREFLWVQNVCDCPRLEDGRQYILMVRRHINYEHTLNRILLEEDSYVVPYRPREDELLRPLERLCSNTGPKHPAELSA